LFTLLDRFYNNSSNSTFCLFTNIFINDIVLVLSKFWKMRQIGGPYMVALSGTLLLVYQISAAEHLAFLYR